MRDAHLWALMPFRRTEKYASYFGLEIAGKRRKNPAFILVPYTRGYFSSLGDDIPALHQLRRARLRSMCRRLSCHGTVRFKLKYRLFIRTGGKSLFLGNAARLQVYTWLLNL